MWLFLKQPLLPWLIPWSLSFHHHTELLPSMSEVERSQGDTPYLQVFAK
jgi:hypothetical protein